ncbi:MAG TPA: hypothetical protein VK576_05335 [Thermoleophilia bacterium]|nr:hypothetical protein [Thermoleophilia bacterium]
MSSPAPWRQLDDSWPSTVIAKVDDGYTPDKRLSGERVFYCASIPHGCCRGGGWLLVTKAGETQP